MTTYDNTNRGSIWGNDKKKVEGANPNLPDFTGLIDVEGKEYWVSAWKKKADANPKAPALSISLTAKDEMPATQPAAVQPSVDNFDDIPF
jgi:hypothetical protein